MSAGVVQASSLSQSRNNAANQAAGQSTQGGDHGGEGRKIQQLLDNFNSNTQKNGKSASGVNRSNSRALHSTAQTQQQKAVWTTSGQDSQQPQTQLLLETRMNSDGSNTKLFKGGKIKLDKLKTFNNEHSNGHQNDHQASGQKQSTNSANTAIRQLQSEQKPQAVMIQGGQGQQVITKDNKNLASQEIQSPELSDYEYIEEQSQLKKKQSKREHQHLGSLSARESQRSCEQLQQRKIRLNSSKALVSIGQLSLNSVTDEYYITAGDKETEQNQAVRKQMIRYLSRVSDRNKPLFMFNQKLKVGASQDSDDCGTPRFSVVSFVFK